MGKILKGIVAIIFILAIAGFVMVARAGEDTPEMASAVSFMVDVAYFLLIITVIVAVALSLINLLKNPGALKKTILGLIVFAVLLFVSYAVANGGEVFGSNKESLLQAGSVSKWSEAGLNFSLVLLVIGGLFFLFDLIKGLIKA